MFTMSTILHPTDLSPMAEEAFQLACSLARDHSTRVIVLHVAAPPAIGTFAEAVLPPDPDIIRAEFEEQLRQTLVPPLGIRVEYRIEFGDPTPVIVQVVAETNSDLIVMGTHGRTGLGRLLLGSVAEQVVRQAPCPVVTVKVPAAGIAESGAPRLGESDKHTAEAVQRALNLPHA
ncbi:MAG: universal stress protein [Gemmataceae bacterium]|nr:universal stress protein [Gemmataceae bacterium]